MLGGKHGIATQKSSYMVRKGKTLHPLEKGEQKH